MPNPRRVARCRFPARYHRSRLDALAEPERSAFEARYAELLRPAYPRRPDGRMLLPFRRLFLWPYLEVVLIIAIWTIRGGAV